MDWLCDTLPPFWFMSPDLLITEVPDGRDSDEGFAVPSEAAETDGLVTFFMLVPEGMPLTLAVLGESAPPAVLMAGRDVLSADESFDAFTPLSADADGLTPALVGLSAAEDIAGLILSDRGMDALADAVEGTPVLRSGSDEVLALELEPGLTLLPALSAVVLMSAEGLEATGVAADSVASAVDVVVEEPFIESATGLVSDDTLLLPTVEISLPDIAGIEPEAGLAVIDTAPLPEPEVKISLPDTAGFESKVGLTGFGVLDTSVPDEPAGGLTPVGLLDSKGFAICVLPSAGLAIVGLSCAVEP